jgi:hypothetical protein
MMLADIVPLAVLVAVFIAAPLVLFYVLTAFELGPKLAGKLLGRFAVCLLAAVVVLAAGGLLPHDLRAGMALAVLLLLTGFLWGYILARLRKRAYMGEVLLDVGRTKTAIVSSVIAAGAFVLVLVDYVSDLRQDGFNLEPLARTVALSSLCAFGLSFSLPTTKFTRRGILWLGWVIYWEQIESYEWEPVGRCVLSVQLRKRAFLSRRTHIPIPAYHKQEVDDILAAHVSVGS